MNSQYNNRQNLSNSVKTYVESWVENHNGELVMCRIVEGQEYVYVSSYPTECKGHTYRVLRFVIDIPSYQSKVLVEGVTGPDKGNAFVVSESAFANKFERIKVEATRVTVPVTFVSVAEPPPGSEDRQSEKPVKVAGKYHSGSDV